MAAVLHRVTREYHPSANTPDFLVVDWIINPDLSAVGTFPPKYWVISGDAVSLMDQAARDAIDAAALDASRDARIATLDRSEDLLRAFARVMLDEINTLRAGAGLQPRSLGQLKTAMRAKLGS